MKKTKKEAARAKNELDRAEHREQVQLRVRRADRIDRRQETRPFSAAAMTRALASIGVTVRVEWVGTLRRDHHLRLIRYAEQVTRRGHASVIPSILVEGLQDAAEHGMLTPPPSPSAPVVGSDA
jgi:hypothetical protein